MVSGILEESLSVARGDILNVVSGLNKTQVSTKFTLCVNY